MPQKYPTPFSLAAGLCLLLVSSAGAVPFQSRRITPYFDMNMSQGVYLPSQGDFFTGANMGVTLGLLGSISDRHSLLGIYRLGFSGQAFRFPDTQEFASKELSHRVNLEYRWRLTEWLRLRPGVSYATAYSRTAAGEIWGEGLYDNSAKGGSMGLDFDFELFGRRSSVSFVGQLQAVAFPNYTDIIREFQGSDANTELAGGLKDQVVTEYMAHVRWGGIFVLLRQDQVRFKNERVVRSDGTYGAGKQRDSSLHARVGMSQKLWIFEAVPQAHYTRLQSNQNFLLYKSVTDPSPVFAPDYYDYAETAAQIPLYINFTRRWALNGGLEHRQRQYSKREARDADNNFISGSKQRNKMVTLTAGLRKRLNDVSYMALNYSVTKAESNNRFERYLPYNYTGQGLSLGYQLAY